MCVCRDRVCECVCEVRLGAGLTIHTTVLVNENEGGVLMGFEEISPTYTHKKHTAHTSRIFLIPTNILGPSRTRHHPECVVCACDPCMITARASKTHLELLLHCTRPEVA